MRVTERQAAAHRKPGAPLRNCPLSTIPKVYEGTNQIQRMMMARQLLK